MRTSLMEERPLAIPYRGGWLLGSFASPEAPSAVALIAADRGHSRQSQPRRLFARALRSNGFATLMIDIIPPGVSEEEQAALRIDVDELAARIHAARRWLHHLPPLPLALIGIGGAGAGALVEAACDRKPVAALVVDCRWPDLAGNALDRLRAPVLFISERGDLVALDRIEVACARLRSEHGLATVDGPRSGRTRAHRALMAGRAAATWLREHAAAWRGQVPAWQVNRRGAR